MRTPRKYVVEPQSGCSIRVALGEHIPVDDPDGQQVADLWAIAPRGSIDWVSTDHTRDINEKMFPDVGDSFYSKQSEPLLTLIESSSPGPHDMLFPPCDDALYVRAGFHGHPNCRDNFLKALSREGVTLPIVPDPVNLFQNSPPQPDGRLEVLPSINPPGGYVVLRADEDLLIVVTACSVDFHPTNGSKCTSIEVTISQGQDPLMWGPRSDPALH